MAEDDISEDDQNSALVKINIVVSETVSRGASVTGKLNSVVLALTLIPQTTTSFVTPVQLTFNHIQGKNQSRPQCSFWNYDSNAWDTRGCSLNSTSEKLTVCQCTHLTNFAILMSPWTENNVDTQAIKLISYITCSMSAFCLLLTVGIHLFLWRYVKADRVVILIHLSVALIFSYVIFLSGVEQTDNKDLCTAVAILLHYIYLVVFFLMLAEGVEIAVTILYVFVTRSRLKWILPLAWGTPAFIVGISAVIRLDGYGTTAFCWLSIENNLIWAFVGPAVLIILINSILLILVMRTMFQTRSVSKTSNIAKAKVGIRCLCVLLPLIGCSWILGVFYVSDELEWLQYAFAVCNGLQGVVIFTFHVMFNEKIRMAIRSRRRKYKDSIPSTKPSTAPFCSIVSSDISLETSYQDVSNNISHGRIRQELNEIFQTVEITTGFDKNGTRYSSRTVEIETINYSNQENEEILTNNYDFD